jgi:YHS domain-containing protein
MLRALIYTLLGIFVLAMLRAIIGALTRGVSDLFREESAGAKTTAGGTRPPSAGGGALKRDPVCGTYVPVDNSVRKVVAGETLYFCSPECRDKYPT